MPWAIGWVASRIIEGVKQSVDHQPLPAHFWWIAGAEVALASDLQRSQPGHRLHRFPARRPLYPSREHRGDAPGGAAGPDHLRGPRLLRPPGARSGAGHRPAGDDPADGPAFSPGSDNGDLERAAGLLLAVAHAAAGGRRAAVILWRNALRFSWLREELPANANQARDGLPAHGGRQQRSRQGTEAFQPERLPDQSLRQALRANLSREREPFEAEADCGVVCSRCSAPAATTGLTSSPSGKRCMASTRWAPSF